MLPPSAFDSCFALVMGVLLAWNEVPRGRPFLGLDAGISANGFVNKTP